MHGGCLFKFSQPPSAPDRMTLANVMAAEARLAFATIASPRLPGRGQGDHRLARQASSIPNQLRGDIRPRGSTGDVALRLLYRSRSWSIRVGIAHLLSGNASQTSDDPEGKSIARRQHPSAERLSNSQELAA